MRKGELVTLTTAPQLGSYVREMLQRSRAALLGLESKGKEPSGEDSCGKPVLLGERRVEEAVRSSLEETGLPCVLLSRVHGRVELSNKPQFTVVVEPLSGVRQYEVCALDNPLASYATFVAILKGARPVYSDVIVAAAIQHAPDRLFLGVRDNGVKVISNHQGAPATRDARLSKLNRITQTATVCVSLEGGRTTTFTPWRETGLVVVEQPFAECVARVVGTSAVGLGASTTSSDRALPAAYGLVTLGGGSAMTVGGDLMESWPVYFTDEVRFPFVLAANHHLMRDLRRELR